VPGAIHEGTLTVTFKAVVRILTLVAALAVAMCLAGTASGAGISGIELTPDKGPTDTSPGPATAFHIRVPRGGHTSAGFSLTNLEQAERTVRLYAAGATGTPPEIKVGDAGGAPWVRLADQQVTLKPGEVRRFDVEVDDPGPTLGPPGTEIYAAVVLEVKAETVVQRAAIVVYALMGPKDKTFREQLPLYLGLLAALAVAAVGVAQLLRWRRARRARVASSA
jgi:hypothetical protein